MSKNTIAAKKIQAKIADIISAAAGLSVSFKITDDSVQAEQRLAAEWSISAKVDVIQYKKDMAKTEKTAALYSSFYRLQNKLFMAAFIKSGKQSVTHKISDRTKNGPIQRAELKSIFILEHARLFLAALKKAEGKTLQAKITAEITAIQAEQKSILAALRKSNAESLAACKKAKSDKSAADIAAIASGEFWEASTDALKNYFHPPFAKNYLVDISARWRAALFLECKSVSYKSSRGWGHKLEGTGRAYLCGIDDNGDEWGHTCTVELEPDNYGNLRLDATVEEAMAELFAVSASKLERCHRQGDLLFRPCSIIKQVKIICKNCGEPKDKHQETAFGLACYGDLTGYSGTYSEQVVEPPHLVAEDQWTVRESHTIKATGLRHNGKYFTADEEIRIEHTSHQPVILPAGEWCLHAISIADAD